jgi:L-cysteine desulfidase
MPMSYGGHPGNKHLISRQIEYNGERWRVISVSAEHVNLDIVNVVGETVRNEMITLSKEKFYSLLPSR